MQYENAHAVALILIGFSFVVLLALHLSRPRVKSGG
jgi:ABC-type sulfate transport system permease component